MKNYEINFGNIPPDLEPDENITLWRYMSFSSLCEILMNNHIPLISVSNFSDKSEGAILKGVLSKLPNAYEDSIQYAMKKYCEATYISSWHQAKNENAAMWDRYTYGGEGVAIKTNAKLLLGCISAIEANHISHHEYFSDERLDALNALAGYQSFIPQVIIKPIKYTDNKPTDFEMEKKYLRNGYDKLCFFYKLEDFEDELEIRILRSTVRGYLFSQLHPSNFFDLDKMFPPTQDFLQLKIDSADKLIQEIVVSPHAHDQFIKIVRQSIKHINMLRTDPIKCDVIESRRKEWV